MTMTPDHEHLLEVLVHLSRAEEPLQRVSFWWDRNAPKNNERWRAWQRNNNPPAHGTIVAQSAPQGGWQLFIWEGHWKEWGRLDG